MIRFDESVPCGPWLPSDDSLSATLSPSPPVPDLRLPLIEAPTTRSCAATLPPGRVRGRNTPHVLGVPTPPEVRLEDVDVEGQ